MAQRYGGKHSPGQVRAEPAAPRPMRRRARAAARRNLLFLAPLPLIFTAFGQGALGMATDLAALAALLSGAYLTNEGVKAEEAYDARTVAKRPAIPRKLFGAGATGFGVALAAFDPETSQVLAPAVLAAIAVVAHVLAFGTDPMRDKGAAGVDSHQSNRVARAVDEAEGHLSAMRDAILRANDRHLTDRVERFQATAREMFRTVERDPRDLVAARRYLGVYLLGARDATVRFVDLWTRRRDAQARADYEALLDDLEANFSARTQTLLADDRSALDIEIEVLRERLQREGVRPEE